MSNTVRTISACILILAAANCAHAQLPRVRVPTPPLAPPPAPLPAAPGAPAAVCNAAPSKLIVTYVGSSQIDFAWSAPATTSGCTVDHYEVQHCESTEPSKDCVPFTIAIKNTTTPVKITTTSYNDTGLDSDNYYKYDVVAVYTNGSFATSPQPLWQGTVSFTCLLFPTRYSCMSFGDGKDANINAFYQTTGPYTFFGQIKSLYNGGSSSATVSADLGTLNFGNGMQVTVTTNVQAGSTGATPVTSGAIPTLSASGAGQATQNTLFGGNFLVSELYPLLAVGASKLATAGGLGFSVDLIAREGIDVQNFKSGTNFNVTSPPFHGSGQIVGFLQYNSINLIPKSQNIAGSLFAGGSYGYSYTSPVYLRDYGFAGNQNNGIGLVVFGIVLNGVARISVSRGFGPSQTYMDSTTMIKTSVNNFKAWSIGVTYQSATPSK